MIGCESYFMVFPGLKGQPQGVVSIPAAVRSIVDDDQDFHVELF